MKKSQSITENFDAVSYLQTLIAVAMSEGGMKPEEINYIELQAKLLNLDLDHMLDRPQLDLKKIAPKLSGKTKRVIIRDCITLAHMDRDYAAAERLRILGVANDLGLESKVVEQMEAWLKQYWSLLDQGERLLNGLEP